MKEWKSIVKQKLGFSSKHVAWKGRMVGYVENCTAYNIYVEKQSNLIALWNAKFAKLSIVHPEEKNNQLYHQFFFSTCQLSWRLSWILHKHIKTWKSQPRYAYVQQGECVQIQDNSFENLPEKVGANGAIGVSWSCEHTTRGAKQQVCNVFISLLWERYLKL